ncbi:hypothetical protein [Nocardioides dilutus]
MRGHPILGFFTGLLFGVFLAVTLVLAGVLKLNSVVVTALPVAGIVYGLLMARWAPFGRNRAQPG